MADYPAPPVGWLRSHYCYSKGSVPTLQMQRDLDIRYVATAVADRAECLEKIEWIKLFSPDNALDHEDPIDAPHVLMLLAVRNVTNLSMKEFRFVMQTARERLVRRHWDDVQCMAIFMPEWVLDDIETVLSTRSATPPDRPPPSPT